MSSFVSTIASVAAAILAIIGTYCLIMGDADSATAIYVGSILCRTYVSAPDEDSY